MAISTCSNCSSRFYNCYQLFEVETVGDLSTSITTLKVSKISEKLFCSDCFFSLYDFEEESSKFSLDKRKFQKEVVSESFDINITSLKVQNKYFLSATLHILNNNLLDKLSDFDLYNIGIQLLDIGQIDMAQNFLDAMSNNLFLQLKILFYRKILAKYFNETNILNIYIYKIEIILEKFLRNVSQLESKDQQKGLMYSILIFKDTIFELIWLFEKDIYSFDLIKKYTGNIIEFFKSEHIKNFYKDKPYNTLCNLKVRLLNQIDDLLESYFNILLLDRKFDLAFHCIDCISNANTKSRLSQIFQKNKLELKTYKISPAA